MLLFLKLHLGHLASLFFLTLGLTTLRCRFLDHLSNSLLSELGFLDRSLLVAELGFLGRILAVRVL